MTLGAFSISLAVKDLQASIKFYENLGFKVFAGNPSGKYVIMKNGNALIGLFHGMFQNNILTFNPGWDENAKNLEAFDDVKVIEKQVKDAGGKIIKDVESTPSGLASFIVQDPDGNSIELSQRASLVGTLE